MEKTETKPSRDSYHHGDLKSGLIEATRQLVEEKGPDHFSVSEACRRAGVSTAAPYKHFKSKEEMLRAVAMAGMLRHLQQMLDEIDPIPSGNLDRIVALGRVYVNFALSEPGVFRLMFGLSRDHAEHGELVALGDKMFGVVQQQVAYCNGHDDIRPADIMQAFELWSFVHGLSFLHIDGKLADAKMPFALDDILVDMAKRVVRKD